MVIRKVSQSTNVIRKGLVDIVVDKEMYLFNLIVHHILPSNMKYERRSLVL